MVPRTAIWCSRVIAVAGVALATLLALFAPQSTHRHILYGQIGPILPLSWAVPVWFVDPVAGSDGNDCQTLATPCATWHEINDHRWGCAGSPVACPRLRQTVTVTFLHGVAGNSDPIYAYPSLENQASLIFTGVPATICTGTLSGTILKNRPAAQPLTATLCAGLAPGIAIVNATHPSLAFGATNTTGTTWTLTQPIARAVPPFSGNTNGLPSTIAEVDTWADGDTFVAETFPNIQLVSATPLIADFTNNNPVTNGVFIYNVTIPTPSGTFAFTPYSRVAAPATLVESMAPRTIRCWGGAETTSVNFVNSYIGLIDNSDTADLAQSGPNVFGGLVQFIEHGYGVVLDYDVTLIGGHLWNLSWIGSAYLASTSFPLVAYGEIQFGITKTIGGPFVWGPGALKAGNNARVVYRPGVGVAAATFLNTGGLFVNNQQSACLDYPTASSRGCGLTLSPTGLDANLGSAISGCLGVPFGAAFCNTYPNGI